MQILICDDNQSYTEKCKMLLNNIAKKHQVDLDISLVESGKQLLFFFDTKYKDIDLIYLDFHMDELDGLETALALRKKNSVADIVFYTVDESKAIEAFDVEALHYIVKEKTTAEKFEEIFLKALERNRKKHVEVISLSCAGEHRNIPIEDILYFEVQNRIVTVHFKVKEEVESFEFYSTLSKLEEFLWGRGFVRIHSAYLISQKYIAVRTTQQIEMTNKDTLPIGRTYRKNMEQITNKMSS